MIERLTVRNEICSEPENAICYINPNDPEGMYNILDLAECLYDGGEAEAGILMEISRRLAAYEDSGLSPEEVILLKKKGEKTNADKIRNMTDEELANLLSTAWNKADYDDDDYDPAWLEWLRMPAEQEGLR